MEASRSASSSPGAPTSGLPSRSSWKPGASATSMSSAGAGPSPATTSEREAASAQRVQPAHSAARSAVKASVSDGSRSHRRSNRRRHRRLRTGAARAGRRRRCAPRTSRAAARRRRRCTADRRRACRGARRAPRSGARRSGTRTRRSACANGTARSLDFAADSIHRRGTRTHMPTRSPSRTRAAVARTLPELQAALAGRDDVALVPTMGALHDGAPRAPARGARLGERRS